MSSQLQEAGQSGVKAFKRGKQVQLVQTVRRLAAQVEALQQKLTQMEQSKAYSVPQSLAELGPRRLPPPGQTAMQAIQGMLQVDEPIEDLLAQLKVLR